MKTTTAMLWVGLGGFLGANARYFLGRWTASALGANFPWGTFAANVGGSFLLGLLATVLSLRLVPFGEAARLALAVGFLGAFTTFSTYQLESHSLLEGGNWGLAVANLLGSLAAGLLALRLGIAAARWLA